MDSLKKKKEQHKRRQRRVRGKVSGTAARPRLCVTRSNKHIYAQIIDDVAGNTIVSASSLDASLAGKGGSNVAGAQEVGKLVGQRAVEAKIEEVVFDRGGHIYHGRVKALADAAREAGLKF